MSLPAAEPLASAPVARLAEARFCAIAVMAKSSEPGRAKTRLVPPLSRQQAAMLNTAFLRDIAGNLLAAGREVDMAGYMAFGPPGSEPFFRGIIPEQIGLMEIWLPNFGECLLMTLSQLFDAGHRAACVLNSDSPTLPTALLVQAVEALQAPGDRVVLGPSADGGYYLLGLKHPHRRLFERIDWSTERVFEQTLERAAEIALEAIILPAWYDVDDSASLQILAGEVLDGIPYGGSALTPFGAAHTAALMATLAPELGRPPAAAADGRA